MKESLWVMWSPLWERNFNPEIYFHKFFRIGKTAVVRGEIAYPEDPSPSWLPLIYFDKNQRWLPAFPVQTCASIYCRS